jgi:hypothetical protein
MTTLTRTLDYPDRNLIRYLHSTHPVAFTAREVAAVEHIQSPRSDPYERR